jgi:SAM-dependent methyltransferase
LPRTYHVLGRRAVALKIKFQQFSGHPREFLYLLQHHGYDVRGIEPDLAYASFARDELGLRIEARPLGSPVPAGGPFEIITLFHVLEHLNDPGAAMELLETWLAPGGRLVIEVPNVESHCTAPHHRFHRAHLFSFNRSTLRRLGDLNGLKPVAWVLPEDGGTITMIFERAARKAKAGEIPANATRVRDALNSYTNVQHYLGGKLVRQQFRKLIQNVRDRIVIRSFDRPRALLDDVYSRKSPTEKRLGILSSST